MPALRIDVNHVTRVEGHGNIVVAGDNGKVTKCEWQVSEAPRFFEAMLVGRKWDELTPIASRICGICSVAHSLVSLKAIEAAMGATVSEQTTLLRKLLKHGENFQSHMLHVGYLALPDLLGVGSVLPLAETHQDALLTVVDLHRLSNDICDVVGGRTTHPVRARVGGFSALPEPGELEKLRERLVAAIEQLGAFAEVLKSVSSQIPTFERETEYISLTSDNEYALYDGLIISSDTGRHTLADYELVANEYVIPRSTAKWAKHSRNSYMVGALARYNLNGNLLSGAAKKAATELGLSAPCHNPFMNSVAQVVECIHSVDESIRIIDQLIRRGIAVEELEVRVRAGRGVAAVEAPRGILFHDYTIDDDGRCVKANFVIPTNQNHANIQADFDALVPTILDQPKEKVKLLLEMLVRAYDPCISCSTH